MKKTEITSLADFIVNVEKLDNYLFRGEAKDYKESKNLASGYRWIDIKQNKFDELLSLRDNFYQEIGYALSERDIENFISYSQHHGLPTELLDISENPLVALFFACKCEVDKEGFVYALDKNNTMNLERALIKEDISKQFYNFEEKVLSKVNKDFFHVSEELINFFDEKRLLIFIRDFSKSDDNYFLQLEKKYGFNMDLDVTTDPFMQEQISSNIKYAESTNKILKNLIKKDDDEINNFFDDNIDWGNKLPPLIKEIFPEKKSFKISLITFAFEICKKENAEFPPMKFLIHQPSVIFDRMVNQQGKFIYQNYLISEDGSMKIQKYQADNTFVIPPSSKQKILKQLDNIGINLKFIYPDPDNIAQYITQKFKR